jgi:hypothetical protein
LVQTALLGSPILCLATHDGWREIPLRTNEGDGPKTRIVIESQGSGSCASGTLASLLTVAGLLCYRCAGKCSRRLKRLVLPPRRHRIAYPLLNSGAGRDVVAP